MTTSTPRACLPDAEAGPCTPAGLADEATGDGPPHDSISIAGRRPRVIVWSGHMLGPSETFVRSQAGAMGRYEPCYCGVRFAGERSLLSSEQCSVLNNGGLIGQVGEALFKLAGVAPAYCAKLRTLRPSLIHAHHGVHGALALPLSRALRVPLVVTFHGADATVHASQIRSLAARAFRTRAPQLRREAALFIAVSQFIRRKLIEQDYPAERIVVHYIGVDPQTFRPAPQVAREPVVLFVGRLAEKKGCEYLIRAMERVPALAASSPAADLPGRRPLRLVILGDGPQRAALERLAAERLRGPYEFLGMQSHPAVRAWMSRARMLAVPSVTAASGDSEGLPTVLLEAQATGLPVVASDHAGIGEAITDGQTGLLAPERDVEALARHIGRLGSDDGLWSAISESARRRVEQQFDLHVQTRRLEQLYDEVVARAAVATAAG